MVDPRHRQTARKALLSVSCALVEIQTLKDALQQLLDRLF